MQRIQQTLAVKVQRSDAEQDVAVALVEQAMDQKDGDQDREGEGYQRNHPLEQPAAGQHRQTEGDEDGKKDSLPTSSGTLMAVAMYASLVKG